MSAGMSNRHATSRSPAEGPLGTICDCATSIYIAAGAPDVQLYAEARSRRLGYRDGS
jgi:hypothetical protein